MSNSLPRRITILALLIIASILVFIPIGWAFIMSLKSNEALLQSTANAFSAPYTIENYISIFTNSAVLGWLFNSAIVAISTSLGVLVISSLAGYGFARLNLPGGNLIFIFVLIGLAIPEQAVIISRHIFFTKLELHNSYIGLILPGLCSPFGVFLMTQYFKAIPKELDEAARLDGASDFQIFFKVLLPLTIPAQATLGIFTFLASWNDYWWPLISATQTNMFTLTVGLAASQINFAQTSGLGYLMAQAIYAALPILLVYIIFQKYIISAAQGQAVQK